MVVVEFTEGDPVASPLQAPTSAHSTHASRAASSALVACGLVVAAPGLKSPWTSADTNSHTSQYPSIFTLS